MWTHQGVIDMLFNKRMYFYTMKHKWNMDECKSNIATYFNKEFNYTKDIKVKQYSCTDYSGPRMGEKLVVFVGKDLRFDLEIYGIDDDGVDLDNIIKYLHVHMLRELGCVEDELDYRKWKREEEKSRKKNC